MDYIILQSKNLNKSSEASSQNSIIKNIQDGLIIKTNTKFWGNFSWRIRFLKGQKKTLFFSFGTP